MFERVITKALSIIQGARSVSTLNNASPVVRRTVLKQVGARMFKAGDSDRMQETWNPGGYNVDTALRMRLEKMRRRSREQFYNNEYAKRFYGLLKSNVIGHTGITLQMKATGQDNKLDTIGNGRVEKAWLKWCKRGNCDVTRKLSFIDVCKLILETTARDGEIFVRKIKGYDNSCRFAIQLIEADLVDITLNTALASGNTIRMGIEFDIWDAPVAYWFLTRHPGDYLYGYTGGLTHNRIPADEIIHLFAPEFVRQSRGYPWGHAAMSRLRKIDKYEEAEITAAYGAAAKMGFYEVDPNADPDEEYDGDDEAGDEDLLAEFDPFSIEKLPPGYKFKAWDPQHPSGNYDPTMSRMLRAVACGFMMSYHSLANDRGDANYGSQRGGTLEDRDVFKLIQTWLVETLLDNLFPEWLPFAVASGTCNISPLDISRMSDAAAWKPRRWDWIDPLKDVMSKIKEKEAGLTTATSIVAEKGGDIEDMYQEKQQEMQLEQTYGVSLGENQKGGAAIVNQTSQA